MRRWFLTAFAALLLLAACGNDEPADADIPCTDEEYWDHVNDECVPRLREANDDSDVGDASAPDDVGNADGDEPDASTPPDTAPDDGEDENDIDPACDADGDGVASTACGGDDCDDDDPLRSPNNPEFCDTVDNDCDGVNNEGLQCGFYAHSGDTLYAIDPFELTLEEIGTDLPNLQDIDTHPNGTLLGVTFDGLYEFDDLRDNWWQVGEFREDVSDPNGMAIDSTGKIFVTSQDQIFTVDIVDGRATRLGDLGSDFYSSGDCVVNKRDSLFMTSKHDTDTDHLLLVNRENGSAMEVGPIGFTRVFGLTAAWGTLYGLTDRGELIEINTSSGEGTLLHDFGEVRFFGAASTPSR